MGLKKDLNLQGNDFSNVATFLFVGLLCFEVVNGMLPSPIQSSPDAPLTGISLLPPDCTCRQVAGRKCDSVGGCYGLWRGCEQLSDPSRITRLSRHIRGYNQPIPDAH